MAVVLGKRSRTFDVVIDSPPRSLRTRRRTSVEIKEDEGSEDPAPAPTSPVSETKICQPLSPRKINTVFKTTKTAPQSSSEPTKSPPKTPRHRDATPKKPITPRRQVSVVSKLTTPRSNRIAAPSHPSTPTTAITSAKALFSKGSRGGKLIGREKERSKLDSFLQARLDKREGGCVYISGPPGCGKSALLTEAMGTLAGDETLSIKKAWINCMSLHTPSAIYSALLDAFGSDGSKMSDLESLFITNKKNQVFVAVLDEIDHLLTHELLSSLFELSLRKNSRLILLGIANALDLADRFIPRLKAKNLEPELLPFLPYTAPEIAEILTARLRSLLTSAEQDACEPNFLPFVHPAAIQLLSKKISTASGDLRKAFDILRRSLELVEMESLQKWRAEERPALGDATLNSPSRHVARPHWTATTAPRATLAHVAKASSSSLGTSISARIAKLNAHQKAVLCVLVAKSETVPFSMQKLRDAYTNACKRDTVKMMPLVGAEFRGVVDAMEAVGLLDILPKNGKEKENRVVSRVGKMELLTAVSGEDTKGREGFISILSS